VSQRVLTRLTVAALSLVLALSARSMSKPLQDGSARPLRWEVVLLRYLDNMRTVVQSFPKNAKVSGETYIAVQFLDGNPPEEAWQYERFQLFIDGKDSGRFRLTFYDKGEQLIPSFGVDTNWHPNGGPHEWKVRDTNTGKEQARNVYYQNVLHSIKIGSGLSLRQGPDAHPEHCPISAKLTETRQWAVRITDGDEKKVLRKYSGYSREINIKWDGRDDAGRQVLPPQEEFGQYWVVIASDALPDGGSRKQMINVWR
jgi:hypothetical protein